MTMPEGPARVLPEIGRDLFDVLVIRTDFSDDESWNAVVGELRRPWGPGGEIAAPVQLVEAPAWSGATPDEVLAAVVDGDLMVVFLADHGTMKSAGAGVAGSVDSLGGRKWPRPRLLHGTHRVAGAP